jgi:hypothetical protein
MTNLTDDPNDPELIKKGFGEPGLQNKYLVLSEEERAKGFVRPLRRAYVHLGIDPVMKGRVVIKYGQGGCGALTHMGLALCETYARDPKFYNGTFCVGCNAHFPVDEFRWDEDGEVVGS